MDGGVKIIERIKTLRDRTNDLSTAADTTAKDLRVKLANKIADRKKSADPAEQRRLEDIEKVTPSPASARDLKLLAEKWREVDVAPPAAATAAAPLATAGTAPPGPIDIVGPGLEAGWLLLPPVGASRLDLERLRSRAQFLTDAAAVALIGAGGVGALWLNNPTWGTPTDVLFALLTGAASRVVVGDTHRSGTQ